MIANMKSQSYETFSDVTKLFRHRSTSRDDKTQDDRSRDDISCDDISRDGTPRDVTSRRVCCSYRLFLIICCMCCLSLAVSTQSSMTGAFVCLILDPDVADSNLTGSQAAVDNVSDLHVINHEAGNSTTYSEYDVTENSEEWKFTWDKETQGLVLSSFYVGYYISHLPASFAAVSFSPTRVLTANLLVLSILQILTVFATRLSLECLLVERALTGFFAGFLCAPTFTLAAKWFPASEKNFLSGLVGLGLWIGHTLTYALSAVTCAIPVQAGWPFVFYSLAAVGFCLALIFHLAISDSPFLSTLISQTELLSISEDIPKRNTSSPHRIPIKAVMTSPPVWAMVVSQIGTDWLLYSMVSVAPLYLKEVLQLTDTEVSLLTGIPYMLIIPCVYLAGSLSDRLVAKSVLTNTQIRKLNDAMAKLIPASVIVCLSYLPEKSVIAVAFLNSLGTAALGLSSLSFVANYVDLAPAWPGMLTGISQFGAVWVSFVVPVVFNHVTAGRTRDEWRVAFFLTAAIQVVTLAFYCCFASGEIQPWAKVEKEYEDIDTLEEVNLTDKDRDLAVAPGPERDCYAGK